MPSSSTTWMIRYLSGAYWSISRILVLSSTVKKLIGEVYQLVTYHWVKDRRSSSVFHSHKCSMWYMTLMLKMPKMFMLIIMYDFLLLNHLSYIINHLSSISYHVINVQFINTFGVRFNNFYVQPSVSHQLSFHIKTCTIHICIYYRFSAVNIT